MSEERDKLVAKLAELDQQELGKESARIVARLREIWTEAAKLIVSVNDNPKLDREEAFRAAANLAEEAAQHGIRLTEIQREQG
jgi:hypothetical protein